MNPALTAANSLLKNFTAIEAAKVVSQNIASLEAKLSELEASYRAKLKAVEGNNSEWNTIHDEMFTMVRKVTKGIDFAKEVFAELQKKHKRQKVVA